MVDNGRQAAGAPATGDGIGTTSDTAAGTTEIDAEIDAGDAADVLAVVYAEQRTGLIRLAALTTGSVALAEEIVQDVFVELLKAGDQVSSPGPWLRRAVVSRCTSWVRRQVLARRHEYLATDTAGDQGTVPPLGPEAVAVRAALAQLPAKQRAAVVLRYWLDMPEREVAEALDCRPSTVRSLIFRALPVLRRHLDD